MRGFRARGCREMGRGGGAVAAVQRLTTSPRLFFSAQVMRAHRMVTGGTPPPPPSPASASASSSSVSSAGGRSAGPGPAMARTKNAAASAARSCPSPLTSITHADADGYPSSIDKVPGRPGRRRRATRRSGKRQRAGG